MAFSSFFFFLIGVEKIKIIGQKSSEYYLFKYHANIYFRIVHVKSKLTKKW